MFMFYIFNENKVMLIKGGLDVMFVCCSYVFFDGEEKLMIEEILVKLKEINEEFLN